jgi:hypothetical protein
MSGTTANFVSVTASFIGNLNGTASYATNASAIIANVSSSNATSGSVTFDAGITQLGRWTASLDNTSTHNLLISNLTNGKSITVYARNTSAGSRTINCLASTTNSGHTVVNMSRGTGQTSVTSIQLANNTGTATFWFANIDGVIVGSIR